MIEGNIKITDTTINPPAVTSATINEDNSVDSVPNTNELITIVNKINTDLK
jgi:hypothetical protein